MPTVPKYASQVAPSAEPGVRVNTSVPIEAFGGGKVIEEATNALSGASSAVQGFIQEEKKKADQLNIQDADTQAAQLQTQIQLEAQQKYKGKDAMAAIDYMKETWNGGIEKIRDSLSNDTQKRGFYGAALNRYESLNRAVQSHAYQETNAYDVDSTKASVASDVNTAVANWQDPAAVNYAAKNILQKIDDLGFRQGYDKTMIENEQQKHLSGLHSEIVNRMIDSGQTRAAQAYFNALKANNGLENPQGLVEPGNIDIYNRPKVKNEDGTTSTVLTKSYEFDGQEVLLPTISEDGKVMTDEEAMQQYIDTGEHLGIFESVQAANEYAQKLHQQQEQGIAAGRQPMGSMTPDDYNRTWHILEQAMNVERGAQAWSQVKDMRLADKTPDMRRQEAAIMSRPGFTNKENSAAWEYVKARSGEEEQQINKEKLSRDRAFFNAVYQAQASGTKMTDALRIIAKFTDPDDKYDQAVKAKVVQEIYNPKGKTNTTTFINLWESIRKGQGDLKKIDAAHLNNELSETAYEDLRKEFLTGKIKGEDKAKELMLKRIEALAQDKLNNKQDQHDFLYELKSQTKDGTPPEEMFKKAQELLKTDPRSGRFPWTRNPKFKTDKEVRDTVDTLVGLGYSYVGKEETDAIIDGVPREKVPATMKAFRDTFGAVENMTPGTPVHNAIQSLMRNKKAVTVDAVQNVLKLHPDGKWK